LRCPNYHYTDFEDNYEDEEMFYGRRLKFADPNLNMRGGFLNPNRRSKFLNSILTKEGSLKS